MLESKKSDVLYVICLDCTYVASTVDVTNDESWNRSLSWIYAESTRAITKSESNPAELTISKTVAESTKSAPNFGSRACTVVESR